MAVIIDGEQFWLWREVDDEGEVPSGATTARQGRPG
jgi:hypothetical protein